MYIFHFPICDLSLSDHSDSLRAQRGPIEEELPTESNQISQETENADTLGNEDEDKRHNEMKPQIVAVGEKENDAVDVEAVELDVERHVVKTNNTEPMDASKPLDKDAASKKKKKKKTSSKKKIESNKKAVSKKNNSSKKKRTSMKESPSKKGAASKKVVTKPKTSTKNKNSSQKQTSSKKRASSKKKTISKKKTTLNKKTPSKRKDKTVGNEEGGRAANENGDGSVEIVIVDLAIDDQDQEVKSPMVGSCHTDKADLPEPLKKDSSITL